MFKLKNVSQQFYLDAVITFIHFSHCFKTVMTIKKIYFNGDKEL